MSRYPSYRRVYDALKQRITNEEYPQGTLIPTETELCSLFEVSRTTIRKAVALLEQEGLLHVQQGRGTEVVDATATQHLNQVTSFTETMRAKGYDVSYKGIYIDEIIPPPSVLKALKLSEGTAVIRIQRIQMTDGRPIAIMTNYLNPDIAPGILEDQDQITSLYAYLEKKHQVRITDADDTIRAAVADFTQAQLLDLPVGHPLLINNRVTYMEDCPIEVVRMVVDGSRYEFSIHLSGRAL
ncbi:GntR family transcriptional regulator [Eubacterium aggregans]|uniref:GntR family transcriptional regulator n=1 Tax=Eubacterium aggregans TaxID=81409 RepID=UPI003F3D93DC